MSRRRQPTTVHLPAGGGISVCGRSGVRTKDSTLSASGVTCFLCRRWRRELTQRSLREPWNRLPRGWTWVGLWGRRSKPFRMLRDRALRTKGWYLVQVADERQRIDEPYQLRVAGGCVYSGTLLDCAEFLETGVRRRVSNSWDVRFLTMFSMSEDSWRFKTAAELEAHGYKLDGNVYRAPPGAIGRQAAAALKAETRKRGLSYLKRPENARLPNDPRPPRPPRPADQNLELW